MPARMQIEDIITKIQTQIEDYELRLAAPLNTNKEKAYLRRRVNDLTDQLATQQSLLYRLKGIQ